MHNTLSKTTCLYLVVITLVFACLASAAQQRPVLSTPEEISSEFADVPCKNKDRLNAVRALFERMGAREEDITTQKLRGAENLVVKRPGPGDEIIVIGAHYDFIDRGCGALDNWSGVVAMAHVYRSIRALEQKKSVVFAAFDREEEGLVGSKAMADAIPRQELPKYCAMINVDSFGLSKPFAIRQISSDSLMALSAQVSAALQVPFQTVTLPNADSDSSSFLQKSIPSVTFSGMSNEWAEILHSSKDQKSLVNGDSVYLGYRLALAVWNRIDRAPCDAFRENIPALR